MTEHYRVTSEKKYGQLKDRAGEVGEAIRKTEIYGHPSYSLRERYSILLRFPDGGEEEFTDDDLEKVDGP